MSRRWKKCILYYTKYLILFQFSISDISTSTTYTVCLQTIASLPSSLKEFPAKGVIWGGLGSRRPPPPHGKRKKKKRKKKKKKEKQREKREKRMILTMNYVKLLHIKCCFSNFSIVRWHLNIKKKLAPPRKSWNDAPVSSYIHVQYYHTTERVFVFIRIHFTVTSCTNSAYEIVIARRICTSVVFQFNRSYTTVNGGQSVAVRGCRNMDQRLKAIFEKWVKEGSPKYAMAHGTYVPSIHRSKGAHTQTQIQRERRVV